MWWNGGRALAVSALHLSTTLVLAWSPSIGIRSAAEPGPVWSAANAGRRAQHGGSGSKPSRWSRWRSSSALASAVEAKADSGASNGLHAYGGAGVTNGEGGGSSKTAGRTSGNPNVLQDSIPAIVPPAGDDVCFEGGCPADVEPPHGADPKEFEQPALMEIKSNSAGPTVWSEFSALAAETGAINLGQGFPNWDPPEFVVAAAQKALSEGFHQYTRTAGHPRLVQLLSKRYSKHFGREVDAFSQVAITIGASQALYVSFQAILSPGDEVVLLEPFFDLYLGQIKMAGGVPRQVPMLVEDGEWRLDAATLRSAVSERTRIIVVNTPHNPTGKVFSREELERIAEVVRENPRILVISDEVYKYMVYSGLGSDDNDQTSEEAGTGLGEAHAPVGVEAGTGGGTGAWLRGGSGGVGEEIIKGDYTVRDVRDVSDVEPAITGAVEPLPALRHVHFATLPGMWDRTVTISSAGKTFSVTGWQVGWVLGPARVIQEIHTMLPYMQFCAATPLQEAMCTALVEAERPYDGNPSYYDWLRVQYAGKRRRLELSLAAAGIKSLKGEGGFFLIGDVSGIEIPEKYLRDSTPAMPVMTHDWAFCRWLALEHGLVAIPTSPFFSPASRAKGLGNGLVRFCFCKTDETLEAADKVLRKMASEQPGAGAVNGRRGRVGVGGEHGDVEGSAVEEEVVISQYSN